MKLRNFWLVKAKEKRLLRVIDWAQRNGKKVQDLTSEDIREALSSHQ